MFIQALFLFVLSFFVLASPPAVSRAQAEDSGAEAPSTGDQDVTARARTHFNRGVEHYEEGNFDAALAEFQRAYDLTANHKLLFNLAQVQMERHDDAAAVRLLSEYLRIGGTQVAEERVHTVQQDLARLKERIGELTIDVQVTGAQVFVNAAPIGVSPLREAVLVNAGNALVRVEKAGYAPFVQSLSVAGADRQRLDVVLEAQPGTLRAARLSIADASTAATQSVPNMTPCWISFGAALVLAGTTATFGVLSMNASHEQDRLLASYPGRPSELDTARGRLQTFAALTDAFAAATLAVGVVGLYFLWSPPERREKLPAGRANLQLTATPASLALSGSF